MATECEKIKYLLNINTEKSKDVVSSQERELIEHSASLKLKVDTYSEMLIEEIRQWNQNMRYKISENEKNCLNEFDEKEFETCDVFIQSALVDVNDLKQRIDWRIDDFESETTQIFNLVGEASSKLFDLKKFEMRKEELPDDVGSSDQELDPDNVVAIKAFRRDTLLKVNTIRDMSDFIELKYCFVNPYATPHELIAIVVGELNTLVFVKMAMNGQVLMRKQVSSSFDAKVFKVQTIKEGFIFSTNYYERKLMRFDYDCNEIATNDKLFQEDKSSGADWDAEFAVNKNYLISSTGFTECIQCMQFNFRSHDLSKTLVIKHVNDADSSEYTVLANDKYLYIVHRNSQDIRYQEEFGTVTVDLSNPLGPNCHTIIKNMFSLPCLKLLGDKYVAGFYRSSHKISLFIQEQELKLVEDFMIDPDSGIGDCQMSTDCSNGLCFFNNQTGEIYHNFF